MYNVLLWLSIIIGSLIVLFIMVLVLLSYVAANKLLKPPRRKKSWTPKDLGFGYEDVYADTDDGLKLSGWFIDRGSRSTVIAIHGYTSSRWDETYMKPIIQMLARNGFNVAAFDFRAHGESEGDITTLGYKEVKDYVKIIDWLKNTRKERTEKLGVIGYSMGGAVSLMLAALDNRVNAVVADSPYIDIVSSGRRWINRLKGPIKTLLLIGYPLIIFFARRIAGVDIDALKMINYAGKIDKPVLIIAGKKDDLVSLSEINNFYKLLRTHNDKAEIWITESRHVESIKDYPREYEEKVIGFFKRWLL